jgi:hypothetical protein
VLRAQVTKSVGPGTVYLLTRLYLADGVILEQTNPGLLGLENGWKTVGTEADLAGVAERLRREGWSVSAER